MGRSELGSYLMSRANSRLEKYSVCSLNLAEILKRWCSWSTNSQVNYFSLEKQSTSTYSLRRPYFSKTIPQKSSILVGACFLGSVLISRPQGLYRVSSTLLPSATAEICLQMGCFNNSYLSLIFSISSFICSLMSISFFLREQRAAQVSCSPSLEALMRQLMCASNYYSRRSSQSLRQGSLRASSSSSQSRSSCSSTYQLSLSGQGCLSFLVVLPIYNMQDIVVKLVLIYRDYLTSNYIFYSIVAEIKTIQGSIQKQTTLCINELIVQQC